jgi:hypothetical protein
VVLLWFEWVGVGGEASGEVCGVLAGVEVPRGQGGAGSGG